MSGDEPSYRDLEQRLARAEALVEALQSDEVDAVVGRRDVSFVRARDEEERARKFQRELERRVAERTAQLRDLTLELTQTEQRERQRLAELLHDSVQQLVAGAKLRLSALRAGLDQAGRQNLEKIDALLAEAMEATRSLSIEIGPPNLFESGLVPALEWLCGHMGEIHGLRAELERSDEAVEPGDESLHILLFQAVRELLFNVVKHAGTNRARVRLSRPEPDSLCIEVTDEGSGFDPGTKGAQDVGTGFGLFSIRERLESLGGRFQLESAPAGGTRVRLIAPLQPVEQAVPELHPLPRRPASRPPPAAPEDAGEDGELRVLIADDHRLFRDGLIGMLAGEPAIQVVGEAEDGRTAVELARRLRPDVVIMDVSMPRMSGIEATRIITNELPGTRVIGLSMHADKHQGDLMREAGAESYFTKDGPVDTVIAALLS